MQDFADPARPRHASRARCFADPDLDHCIATGVSPRGAQALISAAKVRALVDGRYAAGFKRHRRQVAAPALLRHRIMRSFEAEADGVTTDDMIARLLEWLRPARRR